MRLNASRGSEQYQATNSRMAWSSVRWPLADVRLFRTAALACSRSGRARTRVGCVLLRDFDFDFGDGLLHRRRQICDMSSYRRQAGVMRRRRSGQSRDVNFRVPRDPTASQYRDEPGIVQRCIEFYGIGRPIRYDIPPGMPRT